MVRAILFDLGGVLVTEPFPVMESLLSGLSGRPYPQVREARKLFWTDYELGRMGGREFMERWIGELDMDVSAEELFSKTFGFIKVKEDVLDVVKRIRSSGDYLLGVISNNTDEWAEHCGDALGLGDLFDAWIISSHHHIKKPDREIYGLAAERLGLTTGDCLFIDNRERNVQGAEAAGMKGLHFRDAEQLEADLNRLGIRF